MVRRLWRHLGVCALWGGHWDGPDARSGAQPGLWWAGLADLVSDAWRVPRAIGGDHPRDWGRSLGRKWRRRAGAAGTDPWRGLGFQCRSRTTHTLGYLTTR